MGSINLKTGDTLNLTGTSTVSGATGWTDITPSMSVAQICTFRAMANIRPPRTKVLVG